MIDFENSSHLLDENQNHSAIKEFYWHVFLWYFFYFYLTGRGVVSLILKPWLLFFFLIVFLWIDFPRRLFVHAM